ncbi:hypothetical protein ElyMa_006443700 [Elysia marginata]|uniref:Uncharacterized protein n=1 Tax=Elysia marginata TaxID=1093978 RepID=A0AAV4HW09_9GAST|nr:hypothetical protein ElyMa_006443700 [Elysia marginata]
MGKYKLMGLSNSTLTMFQIPITDATLMYSSVGCVLISVILIEYFRIYTMGEPSITVFSKIQRPIQTFLRPAVWVPGLRNLHSHRETWTFKEDSSHQGNLDSILNAINKVIAKDTSKFYWHVQQPAAAVGNETTPLQDSKSFVRIFTFTRAEWLDITEITLSGNKAEVWAFSSGFLPLIIPLACFLNVPFFFFPFLDMGLNKQRMDRIIAEMDAEVQRS